MTRIAFFLTTVVSLAAQTPTPPVAVKPRVLQAPYYERLDIVYRVEPGPRITEIRSGELRVGRSKNLTAPQRNEAGEIQVRELVRIRGGVTEKIEVPAEKTYDEFSWEIPAAEPSDVIRFTVEQRMDLMEAGGDWVSAYALFAYFPVLKGTLRLELPAGFAGTVTSDPLPERGGHEWDLSKDSSSSPEIEVNSFTRWQDVSRWILSQCPARPDPTVSEFARKAAAGAATSAAKVLAVLKALNDEGPIQDARTDSLCHPVEEVFVAALAALEIPTDRFLVAEKAPEAIRLGSLTGSYVRVRAGSEELWFDMNASDQVDGLRLEAGTEAVLPLLATGAAWSAPLVTLPGVRLEPGGMDARLDAGVSSLGKLQGSATFKTVNGSQFLNPEEGRKLGTMTLQVGGERYLLEKDYFLVPVEIRTKTAMGLFKLLNDPVPLPGGGLYLGAPGTYREEIRLEIPKDRRVRTNVNLNVDRPFGRYQSRARVEGSTLVITRELELRRAYAPPEEVTAALALADRMREDQETKFEFQRLGAVDWAQWVEALPPGALNAMAYKAFVNAEHEGGMAVTERAVTLRPEDPYPWRIKGELHMRADERAKALAAFDVAAKFDPAIRNLFLYQSLQLQLGRGEALIQELRGRIERNPKDFDAYRVLANTLTNLKHWAEAEEALTVAQQSPDFPAAQRQGLAAALAVIRVCAGTSLDPETELRNVGTTRSAVLQLNAMVALVGCEKNLDLVEAYCDQFFGGMEAGLAANLPDLRTVALTQGIFSEGLRYCGEGMLLRGEIEPGLQRLRAAARLLSTSVALQSLARALWRHGQREESVLAWIDAISIDRDELEKVPDEIRARVAAAPPTLQLPAVYRLPDEQIQELAPLVPEGETLYFLARTDENGVIRRVTDLAYDLEPAVQRALVGIAFDPVEFDGHRIPTVQTVIVQNVHGKVEVLHSTGGPAFAMVQMRRPEAINPTTQQLQPLAR